MKSFRKGIVSRRTSRPGDRFGRHHSSCLERADCLPRSRYQQIAAFEFETGCGYTRAYIRTVTS